jgi:hypothetical protein
VEKHAALQRVFFGVFDCLDVLAVFFEQFLVLGVDWKDLLRLDGAYHVF